VTFVLRLPTVVVVVVAANQHGSSARTVDFRQLGHCRSRLIGRRVQVRMDAFSTELRAADLTCARLRSGPSVGFAAR
jgi:hypothetical protein